MTRPRTMKDALRPTADPGWVLAQAGFDPLRDSSRQSRFAVSNGFLGIPGARAILHHACGVVQPRVYVAGLFDARGDGPPLSALVPAPDWLRLSVVLPKGASSRDPDEMSSHDRTLDLRRGLLLTGGCLLNGSGVVIRLHMLRLVSLETRAIGLQLVRFEVEAGDAEITLQASFDGLESGLLAERLEQDLGVWRTGSSGKRLAMASGLSLRIDGEMLAPRALGAFEWAWTWNARPGQVACFERMVAVVRHDTRDGDPGGEARDALGRAQALGWRGVLSRHEAAWVERWERSDVSVEGDPAAQQALRFALYHLNGAANPADPRVSIAARALTGGDYSGHVFWDTEIFLMPFFVLTWPEAARTLLMYRFRTLPAAREKAARMGFQGAMYAWESADTGAEETPEHAIGVDRKVVDILCGTQEQHISADIAYAVWQYWQATGDEAFLREAGGEILLETARFWASRAQPEADGRRHIRGVIGPDEYHETIDDNAFTNVMARWNIARAIEVAALLRDRAPEVWTSLSSRIALDDAELRHWSDAADTIVTGLDPVTGLFEQFAGFFDLEAIDLAIYAGRSVPMDVVLGRERTKASQVIKQADVVALLGLLPEAFAGEAGARNFAYYEPRCSHGSSLSGVMHGLAAARLGHSEMALRFFRQACAIDLADTHAGIDGGVHIATLGGIWTLAVFGFAGLSMRADAIELNPQLPRSWRILAFPMQWRGRRLSIRIDAAVGDIEATLDAGSSMTIVVAGVSYELRPGAQLRIPLMARGKPEREGPSALTPSDGSACVRAPV